MTKTFDELLAEHKYAPYQESNSDSNLIEKSKLAYLFSCAYGLGLETVRTCLMGELKAEINVQDSNGMTILHHVITTYAPKRDRRVDILIEAGADPNLCTHTGLTPLIMACSLPGSVKHNRRIVRTLLAAGADVNFQSEDGVTALSTHADWIAHIDVIQMLIEAGADINKLDTKGLSALWIAIASAPAHHNYVLPLVRLLLKKNKDINAKYWHIYTPLRCVATYHRSTEDNALIQMLLDAGADPNISGDDGQTALTQAIKCLSQTKNLEIIRILLDAGAGIGYDARKPDSLTVLDDYFWDYSSDEPNENEYVREAEENIMYSLYELVKIYYPRIILDYENVPNSIINRVRDLDQQYAVWQTIMSRVVLPSIRISRPKLRHAVAPMLIETLQPF